MGRQIRARHEEAARNKQKIDAVLTLHSTRNSRPESRVRPADKLMTPLVKDWWPFHIRSADTWTCRTRSHDERRQRVDLIRHLFQLYAVPKFLEDIWSLDARGRPHPDAAFFASWYVAVATGQSLHKECAKAVLSRKETHIFLSAPAEFTPSQNVWWTRATAAGAKAGVSCNIARSKLARQNLTSEFWISVLRFLVKYPEVRLHEADDLLDYLEASLRDNAAFSMKGRTLESVRMQSIDWHRLQAKHRDFGDSKWDGSDVQDWEMSTGNVDKGNLVTWRIRQIKNGRDLVKEGHAQHHCVGSYKSKCATGASAIFSMTREQFGSIDGAKRALTIELDRNDRIVQVRGYANRMSRPDEKFILDCWMKDCPVTPQGYGY